MINLPAIKIIVDKRYLTNFKEQAPVQGYLLAADCRPNDIIRFTVFLESGAVWSGLPLEAIYCDKYGINTELAAFTTDILQPFTCLEGPYSFIAYDLIKNAELETKLGLAYYLFTINYEGQGLAEDPEQYKTHNIIVLENGQLAALPNNYIKVKDAWLSGQDTTEGYSRSNKYYFAGG